jgi:hypothetical protein
MYLWTAFHMSISSGLLIFAIKLEAKFGTRFRVTDILILSSTIKDTYLQTRTVTDVLGSSVRVASISEFSRVAMLI